MPVIKVSQSSGSASDYIEPGTYAVEVMDVEEFYLADSPYGDGHMLKLRLKVDGSDSVVEAAASYKLSPRTKLYGWVSALGFQLDDIDEFDTDMLIGAQAFAVVVDNVSTNGTTYSRVDSLVPLPKKAAAKAAPAPAVQKVAAGATSVINGDGSANWTVFWAGAKEQGVTRKAVTDRLDGIPFTEVDGPTAQEILDELSAAGAAG